MPYRLHILLCAGTGCVSNRSLEVKEALEKEIKQRGLENEIQVIATGCNGFCGVGPIMLVQPDGIFYQKVSIQDIPALVEEHLVKGRPYKKLMFTPSEEAEPIPKMSDIPFFAKQMLIALRNRGLIDPENIEEYIARDGYKALGKVLSSMTPEQVIEEVKASGLRGRGGGGFPTGLKWEVCRNAIGDEKYLICNCDEGDPGAFMDRSIVESDPHSVIEGMAIGAYAVGVRQGYIYVRMEYPLALKRFMLALDQALEYGLMGENILGTNFSFDIEVHRGAGAFVCGEETALIASIEGKPGEPRAKYIYPAQQGLRDMPTLINNVETWVNIPVIIQRGAKWFSSIGTRDVSGSEYGGSTGTKVFSLVGKVNNTGLVEVPMGITLREVIFDIGGISDGRRFKAVQTGGPSGGCIPDELLDLPVDFDRLLAAGSMMGSGGLIVMDEDTCMVDLARYFIDFLKDESCGKCVPCREGLYQMWQILNRICEGKGEEQDIEHLQQIGELMTEASLCALGATAPNPVLSTLRHFRKEYEEHIKYRRCPAAVCEEIISTPCKYSCSLDTDIPAFVALVNRGRYHEAFEVIRKTNPFPIVTSLVCHHPCEDRCRCGELADAISIKALKRFVAEEELKRGLRRALRAERKYSEKIAIIGAGPAGLAAAYDLAQFGYEATVFESSPVAGGMLATAIPEYRLPMNILNLEIDMIRKSGVKIRINSHIGKDVQINDLFRQGYKAILIATGAHESMKLGIAGEELEGFIDALEFLKTIKRGEKVTLGKKVGVIGGGNSAIDAARTALRMGSEVSIIYRRTRAEMPAMKSEIEEGFQEGIKFQFLTAPKRVLSHNSRLAGIECLKMRLGELDATGRRRPIPIEGSEFTIELDNLIPAIGERPDVSFLPEALGLKLSRWNTIIVDPETLATQREGVFAAGDVVTGPSTIADSIAQGKTAAISINKYLRGEDLKREYSVTKPSVYVEPVELTDEELEELMEMRRAQMPCLSVETRIKNFDQVELGFDGGIAVKEARRCLRCDIKE